MSNSPAVSMSCRNQTLSLLLKPQADCCDGVGELTLTCAAETSSKISVEDDDLSDDTSSSNGIWPFNDFINNAMKNAMEETKQRCTTRQHALDRGHSHSMRGNAF